MNMLKKNTLLKAALLLISVATIVSLIYFKMIIIQSNGGQNYFPFYKSMTYIEYAETTIPGFIEFVALICISLAYVFFSLRHFTSDNKYIYLFLGIFEIIIILIFLTNIITFNIVHHDEHVFPGITLFLMLINSILAIIHGWPWTKKEHVESDPKTGFVDPNKIRPVAEVLKIKRQRALFTQQQLADEVQVSRNTVYRWESGESHPNMDYMVKVAQALNFPVSDFWGDDENEVNRQIADVVKGRELYRQAAYFLLSIFIVLLAILTVTFFGKNIQSPNIERFNPFIKEEVGYALVEDPGKQKTAVIDTDYGDGNIITINGSYSTQSEYIKVVHKGAYVEDEVRNIKAKQVPDSIKDNLDQVTHFSDPQLGLKRVQQSYHKRDI